MSLLDSFRPKKIANHGVVYVLSSIRVKIHHLLLLKHYWNFNMAIQNWTKKADKIHVLANL